MTNESKFKKLKALKKDCSMGDSYCKGYNAAVLDALRIYGKIVDPKSLPTLQACYDLKKSLPKLVSIENCRSALIESNLDTTKATEWLKQRGWI